MTDLPDVVERPGQAPLEEIVAGLDGVGRVKRDRFGALMVYYETEATTGDVEAVAQAMHLNGWVFTTGSAEALSGWHRFQKAERLVDFDGWPGVSWD